MKLSQETLKKFIKGAINIRKEGAYICPLRYEEAQIEMFKAADKGWHWRSQFSATTRIELITDATELRFDYFATDFSSSDCTFDLYVDGVAHEVWKVRKFNFDRVNFALPEGKKLVAVYLPTDCHIKIKNFNINGGYKSVKDKGDKVLIIGDSITQGYGTFMSGASYVNSFKEKQAIILWRRGSADFLLRIA